MLSRKTEVTFEDGKNVITVHLEQGHGEPSTRFVKTTVSGTIVFDNKFLYKVSRELNSEEVYNLIEREFTRLRALRNKVPSITDIVIARLNLQRRFTRFSWISHNRALYPSLLRNSATRTGEDGSQIPRLSYNTLNKASGVLDFVLVLNEPYSPHHLLYVGRIIDMFKALLRDCNLNDVIINSR
jgi:hypothetical protein